MATLGQLVNRKIQAVKQDTTIREAAELMKRQRIGSLLVEKDGQYVGIVTETDIVRKAAAQGLDLKKEKVITIASSPVITLDIYRTPQDAHDLMGEVGVRHLGISDKGKVIGIVSVRDLLVFFKKQSEPRMGID
ncbi:MAG TPA: CBS domain-containing protein [Nitrospiria bacterium]|jgi:CBS domain-containing protein|nr:CBS domain-containing protein [Nitrospiria bacterium]